MKRKKRKFNKNIKYILSGLIIALLSLFSLTGNFENINWKSIFSNFGISDQSEPTNEDFDMSVHFMNVGKADCAYIKCKNHSILIDAADKEPYGTVTEYLKKQGVSKLDLVVISHPHRDHIGQMAEVIKEFKVDKFLEPNIPDKFLPTTMTYEKMLKEISKKNINSKLVKGGETFNLGDMHIEIFGPLSPNENLNNNSVVMKITYKNVSFLFMGDAEKIEEAEILSSGVNVKSTVLKVGHHGSRTSSSQNFLEKVQPQYSIISVGPDKSNLPKEEIIKRISKICKNIYRTDLNGNIIVSTNGKDIKVLTEK